MGPPLGIAPTQFYSLWRTKEGGEPVPLSLTGSSWLPQGLWSRGLLYWLHSQAEPGLS